MGLTRDDCIYALESAKFEGKYCEEKNETLKQLIKEHFDNKYLPVKFVGIDCIEDIKDGDLVWDMENQTVVRFIFGTRSTNIVCLDSHNGIKMITLHKSEMTVDRFCAKVVPNGN